MNRLIAVLGTRWLRRGWCLASVQGADLFFLAADSGGDGFEGGCELIDAVADNVDYLTRAGGHSIAGERMRSGAPLVEQGL